MRAVSVNMDDSHKHKIEKEKVQIAYRGMIHVKIEIT